MKHGNLKALIIGYGSIGKRHDEVLSSLAFISDVELVTKQNIPNKNCYVDLPSVPDLSSYDYYLIASETSKHFEQLSYLEKNLEDKLIFCEKPLFDSLQEYPLVKNQLFVGYVLRFHPLLQELKSRLANKKVLYANIRCGQYLPTWRPNTDYRTTYSAQKSQGGGVLLDLSHELDYAMWLLGDLEVVSAFQGKISDLEINSDDLTTFLAQTTSGTQVNISLDYISKITYRDIILHTKDESYYLDLVANEMTVKDKQGVEQKIAFEYLERNSLFKQMHSSILSKKTIACNYEQAISTMKAIAKIQKIGEG